MRNNPRKDLIIKSAKERFARYGFKKTSMNDIAADLRMGKATLYHYYKTKEEVFNAVIKFELNEFMKELSQLEKNKDLSLNEKLVGYLQIRQKTLDDGSNLAQIQIDAVGFMHLLTEKSIYFNLVEAEEKFLQSLLKEHLKKEKFSDEEIRPYVQMIARFARGLILMSKVDSKKTGNEFSIENEWKTFVNGVISDG
ncbi:MAG: TetR/AcrR family transcriptional regulator [Bacteroidetes bacterium]|nr:TetR/AcrR family transcriptional regulator [Bacteroidota bacterium]